MSYESLFGEWSYANGIPVYWVRHDLYAGNLDAMKAWCTITYGQELSTGSNIEWRWMHMFDKFIFKTEADRLMFTLRWS